VRQKKDHSEIFLGDEVGWKGRGGGGLGAPWPVDPRALEAILRNGKSSGLSWKKKIILEELPPRKNAISRGFY